MTSKEALDILAGLVKAKRERINHGVYSEILHLSISIKAFEAFEIACKALKKEIEEEEKKIKRYDVGKIYYDGEDLCVTRVYKALGKIYVDLINKKGNTYCVSAEDFEKTGHIDSLDKWLEGE